MSWECWSWECSSSSSCSSSRNNSRKEGHLACKKCGDGGGGHWLVRMEWRPAGWPVCLPLLLFSCTIKSRSSLLAPAHLGGPGKRAIRRFCVCVCVCVYLNRTVFFFHVCHIVLNAELRRGQVFCCFSVVQISVKRCHNDGCDTRIHGIKVKGCR